MIRRRFCLLNHSPTLNGGTHFSILTICKMPPQFAWRCQYSSFREEASIEVSQGDQCPNRSYAPFSPIHDISRFDSFFCSRGDRVCAISPPADTLPPKTTIADAKPEPEPAAPYGCESWTLRKNEETRIDAFDVKGLRKIHRVSSTAKKTKWVAS